MRYGIKVAAAGVVAVGTLVVPVAAHAGTTVPAGCLYRVTHSRSVTGTGTTERVTCGNQFTEQLWRDRTSASGTHSVSYAIEKGTVSPRHYQEWETRTSTSGRTGVTTVTHTYSTH